jgi:hypothetical protein
VFCPLFKHFLESGDDSPIAERVGSLYSVGHDLAGSVGMAQVLGPQQRTQKTLHDWIESEKAGCDIGFERALIDWILKYRSAWREDDIARRILAWPTRRRCND